MNLKPKQIKILDYLKAGYSNKKIANEISVEEVSIKRYLTRLYKKIGAQNRASAVAWYLSEYRPESTARATPDPGPDWPNLGTYAYQNGLLAAFGALCYYLGGDDQNRVAWGWLLSGDFAQATQYHASHGTTSPDATLDTAPPEIAASHAALITLILLLAGDIPAADEWMRQSDPALLPVCDALRIAVTDHNQWQRLHTLCHAPYRFDRQKHLAMVSLFHLYRLSGDSQRTAAAADAIYTEITAIKAYLCGHTDKFHSLAWMPEPATA
ncbi:MAG: helix-turn-helix transcriptional regulator [Betaproteobacteria bacterium]|nr:helix-turn-helix transcriptional regulator [Betaproteobacteria bacterium]